MLKRPWLGAVPAALLAAAGALAYGYSLGASSNHALYLPAVLERLQPGLYAGDPTVAAAGRAPTLYWDVLALLARLVGLEAAAFGLWLAAALGLGAVTWRAARSAGAGRAGALLAAGFVAVSGSLHVSSAWAGDPLAKPFADPTAAAWVLALAAAASWSECRTPAVGGWLFAAGLLSPLTAWLTGAALTAASWPERRLAARSAAAAGAALAAAALVLAALGRLGRGDLALVVSLTPNTYTAAVWPGERWLGALCWGALWAAVTAREGSATRLARLVWSCLGLGVLGALAAAASPSIFAAFLPLRLDAPAAWAAAVAGACVIERDLDDDARWPRALAVALVLFSPLPGPVAVLWAALLWLVPGAAAAVAVGLGLPVGLWALTRGAGHWSATPPSAALGMAALGSALAAVLLRRAYVPRAARWGAALGAALWVLAPLRAALRRPRLGETLSAAEALARRAPAGARFAVPPDASGFRLRSRHPVCAEWTDFNLALFDGGAAAAWKERMAALGVDWALLPGQRAAAVREWDRAFLTRRPAGPAGGVPGWRDLTQARAAAAGCGAAYLVWGDGLVATGPGRS